MTTRPTAPPDERWLSKTTAAERLDVSTATIDRMIRAGELEAYALRGKNSIRVKASDVRALLVPRRPA